MTAKTLAVIIRGGGWAEMAAAYNELSRTSAPLDPSRMGNTIQVRQWLRHELGELKAYETLEKRRRDRW